MLPLCSSSDYIGDDLTVGGANTFTEIGFNTLGCTNFNFTSGLRVPNIVPTF
ncbi:hypothetical protein [Clostridium botulinum]|uniref:hypothetical protein n=1 Tax=Clostridium botulinum TaxID=1491 RepID=UPI000409F91B|nr:hypothetical protein [Clostridium botulinum]